MSHSIGYLDAISGMPDEWKADHEVMGNYQFFENIRPELKLALAGKTALLHKRKIIAFYDDEYEAYLAGVSKYGKGKFSVQPIDQDTLSRYCPLNGKYYSG